MKEEAILQLILDYVRDDRQKQAVLLDGTWGTGKTYFAKEILLPRIAEDLTNHKMSKEVIYVSLYGLMTTNEILNEIYQNLLQSIFTVENYKLKQEKIGRFGLKLLSSTGSSIRNAVISQDNMKNSPFHSLELEDILSIQKLTIIFDDLERCGIEMNHLLGFINNLVEHNGIKAVIIANEEEITTQDGEKFSYSNVKEKLIEFTIKFQPDFSQLFDTILKINGKSPHASLILRENKHLILEVFENHSHYNARTLIFVIMTFEKIYQRLFHLPYPRELENQSESVLLELKKMEFSNILKYTSICSVRSKMGHKVFSWEDEPEDFGVICWGEYHAKNCILGYLFVDELIYSQNFNAHMAIRTVSRRLNILYKEKAEETKGLSIFSLDNDRWFYKTESEVRKIFLELEREIRENQYEIPTYRLIVYNLVQLLHYKVLKDEIQKLMPLVLQSLETKIQHTSDKKEINGLLDASIMAENQDMRDTYEFLILPIIDKVKPEPCFPMEVLNEILHQGSEHWGNEFFHF